ncbi:Alpha/Beta hydrolase protein [Chaetomium tenue]|uniref:Alpha/Beta hydrolase protein n=1 Tax=Chaetomium tenue TaxID=1854479 RepID=A0ACB7P6I3_9PEZI|nr:Alpha/Beta hydrolase protein [Chaetomium globosum]
MLSVWRGTPAATNGTLTVSDTFTIKGTYCNPKSTGANKPPKGLQILVHGITYNKTMWAGFGFSPSDYSWHTAATSRGYATLALDRLGHGANPQHPDPLSVVQPQVQIDIMHAIFAAARSATAPLNAVLGRVYDKVVFVGHSYGAFLGAALGAQYPADADALVLAGYSSYFDFSDMIGAEWASAADHDPARFGGLAKGYVAMADETQRTETFYVGGYDAAIPPVDFAYEDTLTVGEIGALAAILGPAVGYTGPVLAVTAVEDAFFCEAPKGKCEAHLTATADAFPDAESFDYFAPENTGHDLTLHYTARDTAEQVHDWLDGKL